MDKNTTITLRVNDEVKSKVDKILSELGIPMSVAIDMYFKQIVLNGGIPFSLSLSSQGSVRKTNSTNLGNIFTNIENEVIDDEFSTVPREQNKNLFNSQVTKYKLDIPNEWRSDVRPRLKSLLQPLADGTRFYLKDNTGEAKKHIIELYEEGVRTRIFLFEAKQNMLISSCMDRDLFKKVNERVKIDFNPNYKKNFDILEGKAGRQLRLELINLEKLWNTICVITGKTEYITE